MRDDDEREEREDDPEQAWIEKYLKDLRPFAGMLQKAAAEAGGPVWKVEETEPGKFAVRREGEKPDAVFYVRRLAYMAAAVLTALGGTPATGGGPAIEPVDPDAADPTQPFNKALTARLLNGLIAKPEAMELMLEAVETNVLAEAYDLAMKRSGGGEVH